MKAAERIRTERLILRRPLATDAEAIFVRYASDPAVTRFLAWPTHRSREDTRAFLAFSDVLWEKGPAGAYLIVDRETDLLLGSTGLECDAGGEAVTGYVLARDAWGRGYATEALMAMVDLGTTLGVRALTAGCHPEHRASQRVLEKGGFELRERRSRTSGFPNLEPGMTQDLCLYARTMEG